MQPKISVIKNKDGRKTLISRVKPGRYSTVGDYISRKYRLASSYISPGDSKVYLHEFPGRLAAEYLPSHRGARTSLRPRHR